MDPVEKPSNGPCLDLWADVWVSSTSSLSYRLNVAKQATFFAAKGLGHDLQPSEGQMSLELFLGFGVQPLHSMQPWKRTNQSGLSCGLLKRRWSGKWVDWARPKTIPTSKIPVRVPLILVLLPTQGLPSQRFPGLLPPQ